MAIRDETNASIEKLMVEKKGLENELLTQLDYDSKVKEIIETLNSLSIDDRNQNYRTLFKRLVINSRTDLTFIIGNENLKELDLLNLPKSFESEHQIKVRGQFYTVKYGVFFNR